LNLKHLMWLLLAPAAALAANSATITITPPTTNTDGSPITAAMVYTLYQGPTGAEVLVASGLTALTWTADPTKLLPGTKVCWKATATETGGQASAFSTEVCKTFPQSTPIAPVISVQ
jgi:hypothetical protein